MTRLIALALMLSVVGCTDEERTLSTLRNSGFKQITTTGYKWAECGKDDTYATGFIATNPVGERVEGTVCCGIAFKGCTVRF